MLLLNLPLEIGPEMQQATEKANSRDPRTESSLQSRGILAAGFGFKSDLLQGSEHGGLQCA